MQREIDGELMSLEDVWEKYYKFLYKISRKFLKRAHRYGLELDDLMTVAKEGMIKAFERFDSKAGVKFITFLGVWVEGVIRRLFRDENRFFKVSRPVKDAVMKIGVHQLGDCSPEEIAEKIGCSIKDAQTALEFMSVELTHLDATIPGKDQNTSLVAETIGNCEDDTSVIVDDFLRTLPEKLRKITELRMQGKTQKEIGKILGISQVQVSRLSAKLGNYWTSYERGEEKVGKLQMTVDEFVQLKHVEKKSFVAIGKLKGVSDVTVHNWVKRNDKAIKQALERREKQTNSEATKVIKETLETAGEQKYDVLEAAIKKLKEEKAEWQYRAAQAEKQLKNIDNEHESIKQSNMELMTENQKLKEVNEKASEIAEELRTVKEENSELKNELYKKSAELESLKESHNYLSRRLEKTTKQSKLMRELLVGEWGIA
ncbi:sigma-70 family RNA polymerase sigma factor [Pseudobacillus sp. FSL P4-0506]|uniref:sigma-70 family RNA polymerase sigma factor n=1 Tax=Pseudobacillus sp. FSL P4-0506 TaxID=2921576 RepID=UPI0030F76F3B